MKKIRATVFESENSDMIIIGNKENNLKYGVEVKRESTNKGKKYKKKTQKKDFSLPKRKVTGFSYRQRSRNIKKMMRAEYRWESTFFITLICPEPERDRQRKSVDRIHPNYYCREYKDRLEEFIRQLSIMFYGVGGFWCLEFSDSDRMHFHLLLSFYNHPPERVMMRKREIWDIWHKINNRNPSIQFHPKAFKNIYDRVGIISYMTKIQSKKAPDKYKDISRWFGIINKKHIRPAKEISEEGDFSTEFFKSVYEFYSKKALNFIPPWVQHIKYLADGYETGIELRMKISEFEEIINKFTDDDISLNNSTSFTVEDKKRILEIYKSMGI